MIPTHKTILDIKGFTFIELLISLAVMGIAFLPLMQMFTTGLEQIYSIAEINTASLLGREEMEKMKNLNFTEAQLQKMGDVWEPPLNKPPLALNNRKWRVARKIGKDSKPVEVRIQVYADPLNKFSKPAVEYVTLFADWEAVEE
jgi:prepilin-type N-terminal cleavage/methylation domain-containing protein